jgi:cytochrome bd ubiquinol oxidase subunit I
MEGLGQTTKGAPVHLLGWYNGHEVVGGIEIPNLLSLLAPRRDRDGHRPRQRSRL